MAQVLKLVGAITPPADLIGEVAALRQSVEQLACAPIRDFTPFSITSGFYVERPTGNTSSLVTNDASGYVDLHPGYIDISGAGTLSVQNTAVIHLSRTGRPCQQFQGHVYMEWSPERYSNCGYLMTDPRYPDGVILSFAHQDGTLLWSGHVNHTNSNASSPLPVTIPLAGSTSLSLTVDSLSHARCDWLHMTYSSCFRCI